MGNNWAVILAAGSSTRMGSQKLLLPYRKSTMIETVVDNVLSSGIEKIMVVLGADHVMVKKALAQKPVAYCYNEEHKKGMLSSVTCGIRALPEDANAALFYLGDQPNIPPKVTDTVIQAYNEAIRGIVIPVYNYRRGHPLLVDLKYRNEIYKLDLEKGLRSLMHLFPEDVLEVEVDEPGILVDIDTREDYSKATREP